MPVYLTMEKESIFLKTFIFITNNLYRSKSSTILVTRLIDRVWKRELVVRKTSKIALRSNFIYVYIFQQSDIQGKDLFCTISTNTFVNTSFDISLGNVENRIGMTGLSFPATGIPGH